MSTLRQVLTIFEQQQHPLTVAQIARYLNTDTGIILGMIDYWIRKGKLREVQFSAEDCAACGSAKGCPFVTTLPRSFALADSSTPPICSSDVCGCG